MLHLHRTKIVSGCSLLSDAKFVRTGKTLTTEKIVSLKSYACRRKSTTQSLCLPIFRNAAYVLTVCVYTSHMLCWKVNLSQKLLHYKPWLICLKNLILFKSNLWPLYDLGQESAATQHFLINTFSFQPFCL